MFCSVPAQVLEFGFANQELIQEMMDSAGSSNDPQNLVGNYIKERESLAEAIPQKDVVAYVADLEAFDRGERVPNLIATPENGLPESVTRAELEDPVFVADAHKARQENLDVVGTSYPVLEDLDRHDESVHALLEKFQHQVASPGMPGGSPAQNDDAGPDEDVTINFQP